MKIRSIKHQIFLSISLLVICVIAITSVGISSLPCSPLSKFKIDECLTTTTGWARIFLTVLVSLVIGLIASFDLSRRVFISFNSVAEGFRVWQKGNLKVEVALISHPLAELDLLANCFTNMVRHFDGTIHKLSFWNAAFANELYIHLSILHDQLSSQTENPIEPDASQIYNLITQVDFLIGLTEEFQNVSLVDCERLDIDLQESHLGKEMENYLKLFEPSLKASGFALQHNFPRRPIRCDPAKIKQALIALLESIQRHAAPGLIVIQLDSKNEINYLRVKSYSPCFIEIFSTNFYETCQTSRKKRFSAPDRTELQWSVVQAIAFAHRGSIKHLNRAKGGSLFELSWPN